MAHSEELAEEWSERRHAALAYLAEVLDEFYPTSPDRSDPWRIRAEKALVRRADGPWPMTAEEAADYLEERVTDRFPDMDLWQVDWREVRGVRGLRILWGRGPSWLPVRAWADNFAAVRLEGLYAQVEAAGAQPLADYIYAVKHKGADRIPWLGWGSSEGVDCEQCEEGLAIRRAGHTSAEQVGADWPGGVNRALDYSGATQLSSVPASLPEPAVALGEESGDLFDMEGLQQNNAQQNNARKDSNA